MLVARFDRLYIMNQLLKIAKFEPVSHNHEYLVVLGSTNRYLPISSSYVHGSSYLGQVTRRPHSTWNEKNLNFST